MTHRHLAAASRRLAGRLVSAPAPACNPYEATAMAAALGRRGCAPLPEAMAGALAAVSRSMNGSLAASTRYMSSTHVRWHNGGAASLLHGRHGGRRTAVSMPSVHRQEAAARAAAGKSTLVLVESPAKARKIEQYLGPGYQVRRRRVHRIEMRHVTRCSLCCGCAVQYPTLSMPLRPASGLIAVLKLIPPYCRM